MYYPALGILIDDLSGKPSGKPHGSFAMCLRVFPTVWLMQTSASHHFVCTAGLFWGFRRVVASLWVIGMVLLDMSMLVPSSESLDTTFVVRTEHFFHIALAPLPLLRLKILGFKEEISWARVAIDNSKSQFFLSFWRLISISCERVARDTCKLLCFLSFGRPTSISCDRVARNTSKLQFFPSFWWLTSISCERVARDTLQMACKWCCRVSCRWSFEGCLTRKAFLKDSRCTKPYVFPYKLCPRTSMMYLCCATCARRSRVWSDHVRIMSRIMVGSCSDRFRIVNGVLTVFHICVVDRIPLWFVIVGSFPQSKRDYKWCWRMNYKWNSIVICNNRIVPAMQMALQVVLPDELLMEFHCAL